MKSSPICNSIRYCSAADPMVPKLSDLSTNVKDRSPDEPIARGASESSRFQDYSFMPDSDMAGAKAFAYSCRRLSWLLCGLCDATSGKAPTFGLECGHTCVWT